MTAILTEASTVPMGPVDYIDALLECGVVPTVMLRAGEPAGIYQDILDADTKKMSAATDAWNAAGGDFHALAAALAQHGLSIEIDT